MDVLNLIPSFGGLISTILAFIVALSIIVSVHEYGHYIVGRWSGIHADVFSLGFGPVLYARTDRYGTRWQIAALPFGGYVKFKGDADAASGKDGEAMAVLTAAERRRTMHGAPLWARAATVAAGPLFNFAFAIMIFTVFFMWRGVATETPVVGSVNPLPAFSDALRPGDAILALDGTPTPDNPAFYAAIQQLQSKPSVQYRIRRDGAELDVEGPFPFPPLVGGVNPGTPAAKAGIQSGDVVQSINGTPIHAFDDLIKTIPTFEGKPLTLQLWRPAIDGAEPQTITATLVPKPMDLPTRDGGFETRWAIGLTSGLFYEPLTRNPGPGEALVDGVWQTYEIIRTSLSGLQHIVSGAISTCNLSGPIGIAETSGAAASMGLVAFIWFIAVLSTAVGLMNLFPIPVLDGGHLLFHAYEAITRRPPSDKALRVLMGSGLVLLLALMVFALSNDVFCP